MGRRGRKSYRGDKRQKELKRLKKKEAKSRRRFGKDDESGGEHLDLDIWLQQMVNLQRGISPDGEEVQRSVDAAARAPFQVSPEELEVLRNVASAVPVRWREAMTKVKEGDEIQIHFKGTLDDGSEFSSSRGQEPVRFTVGQGQVIKGVEEAVVGMEVGESKTVTIPCERAYGARREELVAEVPRTELPEDVDPRPGLKLKLLQPGGVPAVLLVTEVKPESVTLDGNHPLAGEDLTFELEVVAVGS